MLNEEVRATELFCANTKRIVSKDLFHNSRRMFDGFFSNCLRQLVGFFFRNGPRGFEDRSSKRRPFISQALHCYNGLDPPRPLYRIFWHTSYWVGVDKNRPGGKKNCFFEFHAGLKVQSEWKQLENTSAYSTFVLLLIKSEGKMQIIDVELDITKRCTSLWAILRKMPIS